MYDSVFRDYRILPFIDFLVNIREALSVFLFVYQYFIRFHITAQKSEPVALRKSIAKYNNLYFECFFLMR